MTPVSIKSSIQRALDARAGLLSQLHDEKTDTYRLFHGSNEGLPGLTLDRYGNRILVQTFYEPLSETDRNLLETFLTRCLDFIPEFDFRDRSGLKREGIETTRLMGSRPSEIHSYSQELGIQYLIKTTQRGLDPYLFLDTRSTRRYILKNSRNLSVLNLFAYTCSLGLCAAIGGASEVWNVDFAESALNVGRANLLKNGLSESSWQFIRADFFSTVRQLAGLPIKGKGKRKKYQRFEPKTFDLVILDPPRWATSVFGAVDLVRDYQSIFKPSLLATKPGGRLICTNHVPAVNLQDWLEMLTRCATKIGETIELIEIITPENDFPSPDGQHPLKIAVVERK
ncbi:MAG: SAM-dependent methyltransferase [Deltaproteobacteria bacterium]|jgi:23S rRNA (cytosine1962-C5)-methyltransferase|nr:SAM-dependent methyltransferase [Deltaproteobacteria bacterium]MBT4086925.1 SAM-dependent methyltransferase [Deltaproteobacteria bacterium]MBT4266340.1 SAM-dependent methyltransferase [Deltaproteobacteria bacterium]MBT4643976.1 SAM-dependent methyltransferase [Deltaproteobacteria bacterium]MBT6502564.1 SAM-dependent methyltransferase [Deltaproteobacteria bacterium]